MINAEHAVRCLLCDSGNVFSVVRGSATDLCTARTAAFPKDDMRDKVAWKISEIATPYRLTLSLWSLIAATMQWGVKETHAIRVPSLSGTDLLAHVASIYLCSPKCGGQQSKERIPAALYAVLWKFIFARYIGTPAVIHFQESSINGPIQLHPTKDSSVHKSFGY